MKTSLPRLLGAALAVALSLASPSHAQSVRGPAEVTDGDSLTVAGISVRLFGIDAPELHQMCSEDGVACGERAKGRLSALIGGEQIDCQRQSIDPYGRIVAVCRVAGVDVGQAMVESGWAIAFEKYSDDYVVAQTRAKASNLGLWRMNFQAPEEYRSAQDEAQAVSQSRPVRTATAPRTARRWEQNGQCLIKGNHSRRGDWIYHLPGMPYYAATRAEAYFCTEEEAQAAGYRRAIVR